jgi:hypothetical protein
MSEGSKYRHLNGDELGFKSMIPEDWWMEWSGDYTGEMILATLPYIIASIFRLQKLSIRVTLLSQGGYYYPSDWQN